MRTLPLCLLLGVLVVSGTLLAGTSTSEMQRSFAQCLAKRDVTLYVADWCPACKQQLNYFGDATKALMIVHCADDQEDKVACTKDDVRYLPTWSKPGKPNLIGIHDNKKLSEWSGCPLPD